jgi:glutamyl/glutaminyl-tRNA synthetase
LPETMVNFLALLGWNPGDNREIMSVDELIRAFELSRLTKSNSLFDRQKLIAFNTEHIKMTPQEKLLEHFRNYLKTIESPVQSADDKILNRIIDLCEGARTLADIERKSRFLFLDNDKIKYDEKAVQKVLKAPNFMLGVNPQAGTERSRSDKPGGLQDNGLAILKIVRDKLAHMQEFTEQGIEEMLRSLAKQNNVGLGKVAQPLRVALCGTTISLPIFDSVEMLGKENTLARIDITLKKFVAETR